MTISVRILHNLKYVIGLITNTEENKSWRKLLLFYWSIKDQIIYRLIIIFLFECKNNAFCEWKVFRLRATASRAKGHWPDRVTFVCSFPCARQQQAQTSTFAHHTQSQVCSCYTHFSWSNLNPLFLIQHTFLDLDFLTKQSWNCVPKVRKCLNVRYECL